MQGQLQQAQENVLRKEQEQQKTQEKLTALSQELTELKTTLSEKEKHFAEQQQHIEQSKQQLGVEIPKIWPIAFWKKKANPLIKPTNRIGNLIEAFPRTNRRLSKTSQ